MSDIAEVVLESNCGIAQAESLRVQLEELFQNRYQIVIDGSAVKRIDTAALQLLGAFFTAMSHAETDVTWTAPSELLSQSANTLGLKEILKL
ncbi:STAS domain-containing protein [Alkalimarinus alittae]|uniref:STAS domain-containing protein n=1 Tax=Alkalimarinus alittae TaxID=2961619 RepID=A0ABY6MYR2_9ALTE|nr:STAS domain-containing protein [Alkalimarinus alittae]UZE94958.1 STAS domain-containing protein [Alkalimarinus alittae]